ncbi:MAG: protease inhibitor I42 family protein [Syntrophobacterales bacterium]|nr:protease inhibitor I42 family protein [Syntrophobacterales bacterium]
MRFLSGIIALFLLVSFPAYAATIELTEKDNGAVLKLQPGDQVAVRLSGNPTTGYTWELAAISVNILEPGLEPEYVRDSDLIGAGGRYTFRFTARSRGYTRIILAYRRTWEKEAPPVKTFEITVDVNSSREKKPVTTVNYVSESRAILTASFDHNTNEVQVTLPDKQVIKLPLAISASGARYSNAYETFWEHHGKCTYTKGDKVVFEGTAGF